MIPHGTISSQVVFYSSVRPGTHSTRCSRRHSLSASVRRQAPPREESPENRKTKKGMHCLFAVLDACYVLFNSSGIIFLRPRGSSGRITDGGRSEVQVVEVEGRPKPRPLVPGQIVVDKPLCMLWLYVWWLWPAAAIFQLPTPLSGLLFPTPPRLANDPPHFKPAFYPASASAHGPRSH